MEPVSDQEGSFESPAEEERDTTSPTPDSETLPMSDQEVPVLNEPSVTVNEQQPSPTVDPTLATAPATPVAAKPITQKTPVENATSSKPATANAASPAATSSKPAASHTNASETKAAEIPAEITAPAASSSESSVVAQKPTVPSRAVTILNNQYLDVTYPGTGWVYLGDSQESNVMRYFGRKVGSGDTLFTLRSSKPGSTVLHFFKNDVLTGAYIDDYLAVTVQEARALNADHVTAPSYASSVPPRLVSSSTSDQSATESAPTAATADTGALKKTNDTSATLLVPAKSAATTSSSAKNAVNEDESHVQTLIQTSESAPSAASSSSTNQNRQSVQSTDQSVSTATSANASITDVSSLSSDDILSLAQKAYQNGKYKETLSYLDAFFDKAVTRIDEGLFLQGQTLESNSEVRNIKSALDTYETLVKLYPQSIDWDKANERITYLKRFYFNIR